MAGLQLALQWHAHFPKQQMSAMPQSSFSVSLYAPGPVAPEEYIMQADRMVKIFTDILTNKAKIVALTRAYNCKWTSITPAAVADSGRLLTLANNPHLEQSHFLSH